MTKNYVCQTPYLSKHTSLNRVFCCTSLKWWHCQMLFWFFSKFWFSGLLGRKRVKGKKWPKMTKKKLSYSISQEVYIFAWSNELLMWFKIKISDVLILLWDRSLSRILFNCFWILFHDSTALTVIEYFPYLSVL